MIKQKDAVVEKVKAVSPSFIPYQDNAILVLSSDQLEAVKTMITDGILAGTIEYSKDKTNFAEVRTYARSMVMNHIKKAKELNGNREYSPASSNSSTSSDEASQKTVSKKSNEIRTLRGIKLDILSPELKQYCIDKLS